MTRQTRIVNGVAERQAYTDDPYKNTFRSGVFPAIAPTPTSSMPVPKKKDEAIDIPKYLRKITLRKVYKLAQPALIKILPRSAQISEPTFTEKDALTSAPAITVPNKYVIHIHAMENVPIAVFDNI